MMNVLIEQLRMNECAIRAIGIAVRSHYVQGRSCNVGRIVLDVWLHHHERTVGLGYGAGPSGSKTSPFARKVALCDVCDSVISDRPCTAGRDPAESARQIGPWAASHFDEAMFLGCVKWLGRCLVGALVLVGSGLLGMAIELVNRVGRNPWIMRFHLAKADRFSEPHSVDLGGAGYKDKNVAREGRADWLHFNLNELRSARALA